MSQTEADILHTAELAELSDTDRHQIMAAESRRRVLAITSECSGDITLAELTDRMISLYCGGTVTGRQRNSLQIALHHCHLPFLHDVGILEYNFSNRVLTIG